MAKREPDQQSARERERTLEGVRELNYGRPAPIRSRRRSLMVLLVLFILGTIGGAIAYYVVFA